MRPSYFSLLNRTVFGRRHFIPNFCESKLNCHWLHGSIRSIVSKAYRCTSKWDERLQCKYLQINSEEAINKIEWQFNNKKTVNPLDIDILLNSQKTDEYLDVLLHIIHQFRLTPLSVGFYASSTYAIIDLMLKYGHYAEIVRVLEDRYNYGLFLSNHQANMLLDHFLKLEDYAGATQIASLNMLQENWANPLCQCLSLYVCVKYLKTPSCENWSFPSSHVSQATDGDTVKIRVKYLRNPYFDGHFDLKRSEDLIGKTLWLVSRDLDSKIIEDSCQLIGWALYDDWNQVVMTLQNGTEFTQDSIELVNKIFGQREDSRIFCKAEWEPRITPLLSNARATPQELDDLLLIRLKMVSESLERTDIQMIESMFDKWGYRRKIEMEKQIKLLQIQDKKRAVQKMSEDLKNKEDILFFFENQDKWEVLAEAGEKIQKVDEETLVKEEEEYHPPLV